MKKVKIAGLAILGLTVAGFGTQVANATVNNGIVVNGGNSVGSGSTPTRVTITDAKAYDPDDPTTFDNLKLLQVPGFFNFTTEARGDNKYTTVSTTPTNVDTDVNLLGGSKETPVTPAKNEGTDIKVRNMNSDQKWTVVATIGNKGMLNVYRGTSALTNKATVDSFTFTLNNSANQTTKDDLTSVELKAATATNRIVFKSTASKDVGDLTKTVTGVTIGFTSNDLLKKDDKLYGKINYQLFNVADPDADNKDKTLTDAEGTHELTR